MTPEQFKKAEELYHQLVDLPREQRAALLAQSCVDAEICDEVRRLLDQPTATGDLGERKGGLAQPLLGLAPSAGDASSERQVGPYRLLAKIGEGGMGIVYEAEQKEPVRRRVAVKLIKLGMDTKEVMGRFASERQALALMNHGCIAKVLDAGATEMGRPYFVMELVKGLPITEHCDRQQLGLEERLKLFMRVCDAVQHAHHKGIVHRDLKPRNVLVAYEDGPHGPQAAPKIIDFGVAKALNQRLTEATVFTQHGQLVGTPEYMSPEQAEMSVQDVDTRSDVYSLGVLLYELLTGTLPFDRDALRAAGLAELHRIIREVEPPKPSTKVSTLLATASGTDTATRIASARRVDPQTLGRRLCGDLDWIAIKCLQKDRARRYGTANSLAADLERYLTHQPVSAGPPSAGYRMHKFVRRNRGAVAAGLAVVVVLLCGIVGTTAGMIWALREQDRAEHERRIAETARAAEEEQRTLAEVNAEDARREAAAADTARQAEALAREKAQREAGKATTIRKFLQNMLSAADPDQAKGRDVTVREVLDRASERIGEELAHDPEIEAAIRTTIGATYRSLGMRKEAEFELRRALEIQRRLYDDVNVEMADTLWYLNLSNTDKAESLVLLQEEIDIRRKLLGDDHPSTIRALGDLAFAESQDLPGQDLLYKREPYFAFIAGALGGNTTTEAIRSMYAERISRLRELWQSGEQAAALELLRTTDVEYRPKGISDTLVADSMRVFALQLTRDGDEVAAEPIYLVALELVKRDHGELHSLVADIHHALGRLMHFKDDLERAEEHYRKALEVRRELYPDGHIDTARTLFMLSDLRRRDKAYDDAESLCREALSMERRVLGGEHTELARTLAYLSSMFRERGEYAQAETLVREALAMQRKLSGNEDPCAIMYQNELAVLLYLKGDYDGAEALNREVLATYSNIYEDADPSVALAKANLGATLCQRGDLEEGAAMLREALTTSVTILGADRYLTGNTRSHLGGCLTKMARFGEAEEELKEAYRVLQATVGDEHERTTLAARRLAELYEAWNAAKPDSGRATKAVEWRTKLPVERETNRP